MAADPAWKHKDQLPGPKRGASKHYDLMSTEDICRIELPPIADDAVLFLWCVTSMLEDALCVGHMWGFELKSALTWIKTKKSGQVVSMDDSVHEGDEAFGMGRYVRNCHETCLIFGRGRAASMIKDHSTRSVFYAPVGEHSTKPDAFFEIVERLTDGEGPYLELFARRTRPGWKSLGDSLGTHLHVSGK